MSEIVPLSGRPDRPGSRSAAQPAAISPSTGDGRDGGEGSACQLDPARLELLGVCYLPGPMPLGLLKRLRGADDRVAGKPTVDIELPFERLGTEYGGYGILLDRLGSESVVYSFGLGED